MNSSPPTSDAPRATVVIRSLNRHEQLCELIRAIQRVASSSYEIVVVDQTQAVTPRWAQALNDLVGEDPRVRIFRYPKLGGPRARNEGCRLARGEIVILMDDDDLPGPSDWMAQLLAHFDDPHCLAVTGASRDLPAKERSPAKQARARRLVLSLGLLKWQYVFAWCDVPKRVETVYGGNVAIRRDAMVRFGLWDECTAIEDELSFSYRARPRMTPDEYFAFAPAPYQLRRLDVDGGMDKRRASIWGFGAKVFTYLHNVVGHHFPLRFWGLYPAYVYLLAYQVIDWLWDAAGGRRSTSGKVAATAGFVALLPLVWLVWLARWAASPSPSKLGQRAPTLAPTAETRRALDAFAAHPVPFPEVADAA